MLNLYEVGQQGFDESPHLFKLRHRRISFVLRRDSTADVDGGIRGHQEPCTLDGVGIGSV